MITPKVDRSSRCTPLRYPGGKSFLSNFFSAVMEKHGWEGQRYVEPYAGGAGAALSLLIKGKVDSIVLNDYDPAVYSFWLAVTERTAEFIRLIQDTPVTVEQWKKQKEVYSLKDGKDSLTLGFSLFFLNRTNRSGILNAGPIGGKDQGGRWKIDARYNKKNLIERVRRIGQLKDKITVLNKDGVEVIEEYANDPKSFFYIDPPYYEKGANLYLNALSSADHKELAAALNKHKTVKWLLSYDNKEEILGLYRSRAHRTFNLRYSAHHASKVGSELMIFSDVVDVKAVDSI